MTDAELQESLRHQVPFVIVKHVFVINRLVPTMAYHDAASNVI